MNRIFRTLLTISTIFATFSVAAQSTSIDIKILRGRMIEAYITAMQDDPAVLKKVNYVTDHADGSDIVIRELAEGANDSLTAIFLADFQRADSLWADLDYRSQQRGSWPPALHIQRLQTICRSYMTPSSPYYRRAEVSAVLHAGLGKWFGMRLVAPNWWYNDIGGPRLMGPILLMLEPELTPTELEQGIRYMAQAKIGMTGQNRMALAGNVLIRALLERNDSLVQVARDAIAGEIRIAGPGQEGIQPDASFHQHGPQQQFGNYGLAYALGITWWGRMFSGTHFAFDREQVEIMRRLVQEGMAKIIWRGMMDVSSCGRQLFPYTPEGKALAFGKVLLDMAVLDAQQAERYRELYRELLMDQAGAASWNQGYTHFDNSDMSVYRLKDWLVTLKMSSVRTIGAEVVNGENLLGLQQADGALFIYQTGREYENIFPVFDFTQVPGTTTNIPYDTCAAFQNGDFAEFRGGSDYAFGVQGRDGGISAMVLKRNGLTANKAWFFEGNTIVCRGSGINSPRVIGRPVRTTVVQQLAEPGKVYAWSSDSTIVIGDMTLWFDAATAPKVRLSRGPRTGNWGRVATMYRGTPDVTMEVVEVVIEHGYEPKNESYTYRITLP